MSETLELTGTVRATGAAQGKSVTGFRVGATVLRARTIDGTSAKDTTTLELVGSGTALLGSDGAFDVVISGDGDPVAAATVTVSTPEGVLVHSESVSIAALAHPIEIDVDGLQPLTISPSGDPGQGTRLLLTGQVVDARGATVPSLLPVVIWAENADDALPAHPLIVTRTQLNGFFSADWVSTTLKTAYARIAGSGAVAIQLDDADRLPRTLLLVLDVPQPGEPAAGADEDDQCGSTVPPVAPNPADLARNPAAFSQDLGGGCVNLTTPNRVVEEFTYTKVIRTSEPEVRGVTFGVRRIVAPEAFHGLLEASAISQVLASGQAETVRASDVKGLSLDVAGARQLVVSDLPPSLTDIKRAAWLSEVGWLQDLIGGIVAPAPVRQPLDADHPIDWDDTPTVYQAITIARGHMVQFREVWRADGYSLGDLLHSLPLAPGQRRRVAIVDWERRTTTTREETLEYEEQLDALNGRDRDVSEIVGSKLGDQTAGGSSNTTWGVAGGIGAGFIGTGFGIFGGVSGSHGGSESTAWQDSSRQFSGDSLQTLRDRVMQRASAVRDQRSTVVQTATQGETQSVVTETIANYNHCHTMTVEYFEVLRHFLITHEVADVRECLFVPLPISAFDRAKALRWHTALAAHLRERDLLPAFDATRRVADNWVGWDYPLSRYSEEPPETIEGELRISFVLPRPRDAADGAFQIDMWKPYLSWLWMDAFELWTRTIQAGIAEFNAENIARRDRAFREQVAPEIAKRVVDRLRFSYVDDEGAETEAPLDATLVSRYEEGVPLYVTLRPRGGLPPVPREKIAQLKMTLDTQLVPPFNFSIATLPTDAQVIVQSGKARYRTQHKQFRLFDEPRILNDLSENDAVYVPTPTSWIERRNPRDEDRRLSDRLIAHLNGQLEFYHQVIWAWLDPQRRFMLLDGIQVPGLGGRSVASVVENSVIGIAGNSLIMPLAPGIHIDPRVASQAEGAGDLRDLYAADSPPPIRISVPTRGVYAEAIMGNCEACERIDDSRYWRFTDAGMLALPDISPVDTSSRADPEGALTPTPLPAPLVQIQNAPALPNPVGLADVFKVLAEPNLFRDITGLEGTQKNAQAAFDASLSAASSVASQAASLAKQNMTASTGERMLDRINQAQKDGLLSPGTAGELSGHVLGTMVGQPDTTADKKAASPAEDSDVAKAIDKAAQSSKADITVSTPDETLSMSFDGGDTKVGSDPTPVPGTIDSDPADSFVDQSIIIEDAAMANGGFVISVKTLPTITALQAAHPANVAAITPSKIRVNPADATKYQLLRRLHIVFPGDPTNPAKVAGTGKLPLVVLVHGNHASWQGGADIASWLGYDYLQQALAKLGIVSVSVDMNAANYFNSMLNMRAQMVLAAIDDVAALAQDSMHALFGRIDTDRIGLMGHSRGGDAVARAAILNAGNAHGVIKAVASVAPTDVTGQLANTANRSVMTAANAGFYLVMSGALDGDISGWPGALGFPGHGFRLYDRATAPKAMVYIPGCDHNRFNSVWTADESGVVAEEVARVMPRPDHERLMVEYVGGLFEWKLLGTTARAGRFDGTIGNTLARDVSLQWAFGADVRTLDDFETPASPVGTRTVTRATVGTMASQVINGDQLAFHTGHQTSVLSVPANLAAPTTVLQLDVAPGANRDWSAYQRLLLSLSVYVDTTTDGLIAAGNSQPPFSIVLVDGAGQSTTISSVGLVTPDIPGKPIFHVINTPEQHSVRQNMTLLRLTTTAATLPTSGLNKADIRALKLVVDKNFPQPIFFDSIRLVKS